MQPSLRLLYTPWDPVGTTDLAKPIDAPRACLATGTDVVRVLVRGGADALPRLCERVGVGGTRERLWALPGTSTGEARGPAAETLDLLLQGGTGEHRGLVSILGAPKPTPATEAPAPESEIDDWARLGALSEQIVECHVESIAEMSGDPAPADSLGWSRQAGRLIVLDLADMLSHWSRLGGEAREPRMALIVRLAEQLHELLPAVCRSPRVVLNRTRQLERVERLQQVDAACLRWLVRQPGRTVLEKAGAAQRVLGVVREEQADTPENRVVRDLIRRAQRASDAYLREHRTFGNHQRIDLVRRFNGSLRSLAQNSRVAQVSPLVGVPAPNYVLQHDARYSVLWTAYLRLLRQQDTLDSAWRWRSEVWTDTVILAALAALRPLSSAASARADALLHGEHVLGRFVDPGFALPPLRLGTSLFADVLIGGRQVTDYSDDLRLRRLGTLCPDLVVVIRRPERPEMIRALAIWAMLDTGVSANGHPQYTGLSKQLPTSVTALLVMPTKSGLGEYSPAPGVACLSLAVPAQRGVDRLSSLIAKLLGT